MEEKNSEKRWQLFVTEPILAEQRRDPFIYSSSWPPPPGNQLLLALVAAKDATGIEFASRFHAMAAWQRLLPGGCLRKRRATLTGPDAHFPPRKVSPRDSAQMRIATEGTPRNGASAVLRIDTSDAYAAHNNRESVFQR